MKRILTILVAAACLMSCSEKGDLTDFENGELTVRVRCSLIDSKQEVKTDYIHYYYKRIF